MIELFDICKSFKIARRESGLKNSVKAFFKRDYTTVDALDRISFKISDGEIVGYIGPNGAGKSTTIKVMCGVLVPDKGNCVINGMVPWKQRVAHVKNIGVVFGQRSQLWWDVPVVDSFDLLRDVYKIPQAEYEKNKKMLIDILNLSNLIVTPARQLSLGQRMRCEIAASLLHAPDILFLDEPTIGLDAVSKIAVRKFIKDLNREKGTTVILTTHDMQDIEALTNRIMLIGKGRILYDGSFENIKNKYSKARKITINFAPDQSLLNVKGANILELSEERAVLEPSDKAVPISDIIRDLSSKREILELDVEKTPVENIIAQMYEEMGI